MATDPVALLRCFPVEVQLGRVTYRIPALPAGRWIVAILDDEVLPGLLVGQGAEFVTQELVDGKVDDEELKASSRDALEAAAGRPWWEVQRCVAIFREQPDLVGGELLLRGFDFETWSLGAFCAALYALCVRGLDKKERLKFDSAFHAQPAEALREDDDALTDAFMRAMQGQG